MKIAVVMDVPKEEHPELLRFLDRLWPGGTQVSWTEEEAPMPSTGFLEKPKYTSLCELDHHMGVKCPNEIDGCRW